MFSLNGLILCLAASGSGSVIGRDPLPPRAVSAMSLQQQVKDTPPPTITLTTEETPQDHSAPNSLARKTSPSSPLSGGMNQPSIPSGPQNAGNVERSDPVEGQGKRVSFLHRFLLYDATPHMIWVHNLLKSNSNKTSLYLKLF